MMFLVQNSLIGMYSACGFLNSARTLFDEMLERDVVSWNSMIKAMNLFGKMNKRNIITWNSMITGFFSRWSAMELFHEMQITSGDMLCAHLGATDHGIWVHGYLRSA
ncbi:hypothetical protein PRUPE_5G138900 [Prunus persica]|uniref:Pentatricopeptide repeat-containing protein n=1 Tax=Prunus persica TaxID=3760 RepID=A0A251PBN6_PRUPE|nr:hypothetical protein PRUPE_5G138900 [Prunus persica]